MGFSIDLAVNAEWLDQPTAMHQQQPIYNDLNASFTSEGTDVSYDSDSTFQIFNELQYTLQKQQQQQQQSSNSVAINIQNPTTNGYNTGIIYGFRTRHLSCIEENDSDSLHSSSIPKQAFEMIQDVDEKFKKLVSEEVNTTTTSWLDTGEDEVDHIIMIDESRLYDAEYFDELSASQFASKDIEADEQFGVSGSEELWQSTVSEPVYRTRFNGGRPNIPDIMTTSCYGALNSSFGSETSGPTGNYEHSTPTKVQSQTNKPEPIYATPEKRRDCNRSFDSSCPSQSSSLYGDSMTSSLDLKCMAPNLSLARSSTNNPLEVSNISMDNSKSEWNSTGDNSTAFGIISSAEDMTDELAVKCITAAEN
ncbi:hypothetical protein DOY81_005505, partial [Sarcophaga bullata]